MPGTEKGRIFFVRQRNKDFAVLTTGTMKCGFPSVCSCVRGVATRFCFAVGHAAVQFVSSSGSFSALPFSLDNLPFVVAIWQINEKKTVRNRAIIVS